jgi:citrate synthase
MCKGAAEPMKEEILFQITKEHLETGLRGVPVGYCTTSTVYPEEGLFYVDRTIEEVAHWEPERVIFLLFHGRDGNAEELEAFTQQLLERREISQEVVDAIERLPRHGHPMALFSAAILVLGMFVGTGDYQEDCLDLIAKIPALTAVVINHHAGIHTQPFAYKDYSSYMDTFIHMLQVPSKKPAELPFIFSLFNILHYDHGGGNLSTFVGKAVASGLEDMYGSIAAAMNALAGPRHGRANQECLEFVQAMLDKLGESATEEQVEALIRDKLERKELIYGFGHAVLRVEDPRATVQYQVAQQLFPKHPLVKMALMVRKIGSKVLQENPKITDPYPNVDAISGPLLTAAGFPYPVYYTVLFGLSRTVGIAIQIVYERVYARGGKGTPIIRPKYLYKPFTEIEKKEKK